MHGVGEYSRYRARLDFRGYGFRLHSFATLRNSPYGLPLQSLAEELSNHTYITVIEKEFLMVLFV